MPSTAPQISRTDFAAARAGLSKGNDVTNDRTGVRSRFYTIATIDELDAPPTETARRPVSPPRDVIPSATS